MKNKDNSNIIIILMVIIIIGLVGYLIYYNTRLLPTNDVEQKEEQQEVIEEITYQAGDKVTLVDNSTWYVLSQDGNNITLLSTANYGEATYYATSAETNYYETSIVKDTVENVYLPALKTSLQSNNGDVTNLKARVISVDEIRTILNVPETTANDDVEITSTHSWLYETGSIWTTTRAEGVYDSAYYVQYWGNFAVLNEDLAGLGLTSGNKYYIRPVIETTIGNIK